MSEDKKKIRHVALEQLKLMLDFMAQHPDFASGALRTLEARHQSKQRWTELAKLLNNHRGARKTQDGWSKYWSDFKNKLKNKLLERKRKKTGTTKKDVRPFSKLEKQALTILGPMFEKKHSGENVHESLDCDPLPREIKQESMIETALLGNGSYKLIDNDVLLGLESGDSSQSSDEECIEEDQNAYELNSIYPKWLMDLERQRAEAELRRAKAEELRAQVSVKTAEAALIQAEALRKLSDAAEKQADAVLRIAAVLENRSDLNMETRLPGYQ